MNILQRVPYWNHHNRQYVIHTALRVLLGIILLQKGINFLSNSEYLRELILQSRLRTPLTFLVSYITFAHLLGGVLITVGLLTRFAAAIQLPILIGAVFFVIPAQGSFNVFEFILSVIVLLLLVFVLIKGPGKLSMDAYLKDHLL